jgi:phosphoacetylglucosamine mutase
MIGIMVTASHNPIEDNGLKMVDFNGEMLPIEWEKIAEDIANANDLQEVLSEKWPERVPKAKILIGADNRPSSPSLVECIKAAVEAAGCEFHDFGIVTTPQFHYLLNESNLKGIVEEKECYVFDIRGKVNRLFEDFRPAGRYEGQLQLDCAGGVGMMVMNALAFDWVTLVNTDPTHLNFHCGAEYAHKERHLPSGMIPGIKSASFDGDADRLVYYKSQDNLEVLGGERLTVLYATALKKLMENSGVQKEIKVVTTGYSNSSSIKFLKSQGIESIIVPTGVKYLHKEAHNHLISIYFESNGHGTMLHQKEALEGVSEHVKLFLQLANLTVGDAVADLLLAEVSLRILQWNLDDWLGIYQDLPNVMIAVRSDMKDFIKNSWDQLEIVEPVEFADSVKVIMRDYVEKNGRTLVRPSGTEPIVRIYAEADSIELCREICERISKLL